MNRTWPETIVSGHAERPSKMAGKRASHQAVSRRVFGQGAAQRKTPCRAGLYARVSTHDQQTLPLQSRAMREYAAKRGWAIAMQVKEVGSGASQRELREKLLDAARRREIDSRAGMAIGSLGPVRGRSGGNPPGTGASGCGFRVADGGPGPDYAGGTSYGRNVGGVRRVRT